MRAYGASCPLELDPVPHAENPTLLLDSADARALLGWRPQLDIDETIAMTAEFYRLWADGAPVAQILRRQARALLSAHGAAA
jgi:CDP-glucose 4,6-dehydratase